MQNLVRVPAGDVCTCEGEIQMDDLGYGKGRGPEQDPEQVPAGQLELRRLNIWSQAQDNT